MAGGSPEKGEEENPEEGSEDYTPHKLRSQSTKRSKQTRATDHQGKSESV